jgi:ferredoxin
MCAPPPEKLHAESPAHQPGQMHRLLAVRNGLFFRELRHLRHVQVAHQGVRLPPHRQESALHLHPVRRGLVPACLPGGGHHGGQGHRRQGGQRTTCVGCKVCTIACPFGTVNYVQETGKVQKCDLCGGEPACADACPTGAITFIDANWTGIDKMKQWADKLGNQAGGLNQHIQGAHTCLGLEKSSASTSRLAPSSRTAEHGVGQGLPGFARSGRQIPDHRDRPQGRSAVARQQDHLGHRPADRHHGLHRRTLHRGPPRAR